MGGPSVDSWELHKFKDLLGKSRAFGGAGARFHPPAIRVPSDYQVKHLNSNSEELSP